MTTSLWLAACGGGNPGEAQGSDDEGELEPEVEPFAGGARLLLGRQYQASVETLLGPAAAAVAEPPVDHSLHDFDAVGAAELSLSDTDIEQYELSATAIAGAVVEDAEFAAGPLAAMVPCVAEAAPSDDCYAQVAQRLGHALFRRPLDEAERARYAQIGVDARVWGEDEFRVGLKYELMALLQAPSFLYISEVGDPVEGESYRQLRPPEQLTRTTLFLAGRIPTLAELEQVEAEGLDAEAAEALAWALLERPEARRNLGDFFDELYRLREVEGVAKDLELHPEFTPTLAASMRAETLRLIEDIVWDRDEDVMSMLDAPYGWVDAELAAHYGLADPGGLDRVRVEYPPEQGRAGILGQAAFLSRHAHPAKTSPTRRGLFIQTKLLCFDVPPPPPGVDTSIPEDDGEPKTLREKLQVHMESSDCRFCHSLMDPLGFGLENYGPTGAWRTHEPNGLPIDPQTEVSGLGSYANAAGLGSLLREEPRVSGCLVRNLARHGLGQIEDEPQDPSVDYLNETFIDQGRHLQELLVAMVTSKLFTRVGEAK